MKLQDTRFALTADPHIENNKNLPFIIKTFDWIIETLEKEKIKHLIILGDFINSRIKIDSLALNKAIDILNKFYEKGIVVFLLLGNHERYTKTSDFTITSIKPFEKHSYIIDDLKLIKGNNFNFICVPNIENNDDFVDIIKKIKIEKGKFNILLAHQSIQGAVSNDLFNIHDRTGLSPELFDGFDRVFLGHFHKRQEIPKNILYVGSPVQLSFGEEFSEKGLTIWNSEDNTTKFICNPNYEIYKTVDNTTDQVADRFVRYITNDFIDNVEAKKIKEELYSKGALEVKIEIKQKAFENIKETEIEIFDLNEIVKKYIELNSAVLDKDRCLKTYIKVREDTQIEA
jgi:exonuclease SbcD